MTENIKAGLCPVCGKHHSGPCAPEYDWKRDLADALELASKVLRKASNERLG
jgi:hypothetical protein